MHVYYKKNNFIPSNNWNSALKSLTSLRLYHYAGNNPLHYIDPTGREDEDLINAEAKVSVFLNNIKNNPDNYSFDVYQRKALGKGKRTDLMLHSLYVVTDKTSGEETTLSFNGTKLGLNSTGAWATNTEMDVSSYQSLKNGDNAFDMVHLVFGTMIDTEKTAINIINSINSNTTYFAVDHKINKPNAENCNTALINSVSIKQILPIIPLKELHIPNSNRQVILKQWR